MADRHSSISRRVKELAIYALVIVTMFIVRRLPRSASLWLGAGIGDLAYQCVKRRRRIALKNLKMALGSEKSDEELRQIARRSFQNMGKTLVEFLYSPKYSAEQLAHLARIEGMENLHQAIAKGKGVILISAHFGNWELIFPGLSTLVDFSAVVQSFKHHRLDKLVNSFRTRHGGEVIKREVAVKQCLKLLRRGQCVAILGDQNAGESGVFIDFFGIPASTPRGPIMLALRTGATILNILDIRQDDDSHIISISEPLELEVSGDLDQDVKINTAVFVKYLENTIREYPSQWLWMHNRWKTRRRGDLRIAASPHPRVPASPHLLVLSDGKPGHYNQSLGIVDRMSDALVKVIQIRFKRKWRDNLLRILTRLLAGINIPREFIRAALRWTMESSSAAAVLDAGRFDAILSTGSSVAAPNLLLGQFTGAKTAVCTRPSPVGINRFDLAILPEHMKPRRPGGNVVMSLGVPNRITPERVETAGNDLAEKLGTTGQRIIGLLLGGDDRHYSIPPVMVSALCDILLDICRESNAHLALTTSRRTDPGSEDVIRSKILDNPLCCFSVLASEPQQENPVPGILGISNVTIVTEDSFSMVCEAASSGKKIVVLEVERKKQGHPKRQRIYQLLAQRGYTKEASISNLRNVILDFASDPSKPKALDDAQTAADALRDLIGRC